MANIKAIQSILENKTDDELIITMDEIQEHTGPLPQSYKKGSAFTLRGKSFCNNCEEKGYAVIEVRKPNNSVVSRDEEIDLSHGAGYSVVLHKIGTAHVPAMKASANTGSPSITPSMPIAPGITPKARRVGRIRNIVPWTKVYNLYEYSVEYLILQTMRLKGVTRGNAITEVNSYLHIYNVQYDIVNGYGEIEALYKELATTLQTGYNMPSIISFLSRIPDFSRVLCGFDPAAVLRTYANWSALYSALEASFGIPASNKKSWEKYAKGLFTGAQLLNTMHTKMEFDNFIVRFPSRADNPKHYDYPIYVEKKGASAPYRVFGMAYVLACNFLKECGHLNYIKPDTHVLDVCTHLGLCPPKNSVACQAACQRIAGSARVTPYALDKAIWLCCSGQYYRTSIAKLGGGAKLLKNAFIRELKAAYAAGYLVL